MAVVTWLLGLVLVGLVAIFFHLRRHYGQLEGLGIPVVKPFLCFGSPPFLFNKIVYHEYYVEKFKQLGKTFAKYEGVTPAIVSIDPEFIKEVTVKQFDNFTDIVEHEFEPDQTTLDVSKGDTWRKLRKSLSPTFTSGKLKQMMTPIDKIADDVIAYIAEKSKDNPVMDFKPMIGGFTLDSIGLVAFGIKTNCHRGEDQEFAKLAAEVFQAFDAKTWTMVIFWHIFQLFPGLAEKIGFWPESAKKLRTMTHDLIAEREKNNAPDVGDFIDRLRDLKKVAEPPITDAMVDAQGMVFLTAGYETTANTIGSMIYIAATQPEIQDKIVEEITNEIGSDDVTHESISKLHYLEACIMETLRIYPPAVEHLRTCTKDTVVTGINIKKGTMIKLPNYPSHFNPEFFPEPEKFKPERFLKENANELIPYTWRPFGAGNRVCIGQRFAILEIKIFMAKLLANYKLSKTPKTKHDAQKGSFFLFSYDDMWAKIEPRY